MVKRIVLAIAMLMSLGLVIGCEDGSSGDDIWGGIIIPPPTPEGVHFSVSPNPVVFGSVQVGESKDINVTLKSTGTEAMTNLSISSVSGEFSVTDDCSETLEANQSCVIVVTFAPTTSGTKSGAFGITYGNLTTPDEVGLSGTATTATGGGGTGGSCVGMGVILYVDPVVANLGPVIIGQSATQVVTLSATCGDIGGLSAGLASSSSSDYTITTNTCGPSLAKDATCAITVLFTPTSAPFTAMATLNIANTSGATVVPPSLTIMGQGRSN